MMRRRLRGTRAERGATAIVVALSAVVLFGAAAVGVDIANLTMERQELHDAVDAAAHAAAMELPNTSAAATADAFAKANDPDAKPDTTLYCVIGATGANRPIASQVPSTCDPSGTGVYVAGGWKCARGICSKECTPGAVRATCNTVRVEANKTVPFMFAPVIGYNSGKTGAVVSAACKGSCGSDTPNPLDIVVMADRTPSMEDLDRQGMIDGIRAMLTTMDPTMHYVALGALHKSRTPLDSKTSYDPSCIAQNTPNTTGGRSGDSAMTAAQRGIWIPVPFTNNYLNGTALNTDSSMAKALTCLYNAPTPGVYGTHLASALKAAGRYVLGLDPNNLGTLPSGRPGTVRKVIIFETDGQPSESYTGGAPAHLRDSGDLAAGSDGQKGCDNTEAIANEFKREPDTVLITIGFGAANNLACPGGKVGPKVRDMLARSASPSPTGVASVAGDCTNPVTKARINSDGDFYFCATSGTEMAEIFKTALAQVQKGVKLIRLP